MPHLTQNELKEFDLVIPDDNGVDIQVRYLAPKLAREVIDAVLRREVKPQSLDEARQLFLNPDKAFRSLGLSLDVYIQDKNMKAVLERLRKIGETNGHGSQIDENLLYLHGYDIQRGFGNAGHNLRVAINSLLAFLDTGYRMEDLEDVTQAALGHSGHYEPRLLAEFNIKKLPRNDDRRIEIINAIQHHVPVSVAVASALGLSERAIRIIAGHHVPQNYYVGSKDDYDTVPISIRVLSTFDGWDALVELRPYRPIPNPYTPNDALDHLLLSAETDPRNKERLLFAKLRERGINLKPGHDIVQQLKGYSNLRGLPLLVLDARERGNEPHIDPSHALLAERVLRPMVDENYRL